MPQCRCCPHCCPGGCHRLQLGRLKNKPDMHPANHPSRRQRDVPGARRLHTAGRLQCHCHGHIARGQQHSQQWPRDLHHRNGRRQAPQQPAPEAAGSIQPPSQIPCGARRVVLTGPLFLVSAVCCVLCDVCCLPVARPPCLCYCLGRLRQTCPSPSRFPVPLCRWGAW